MAINATNTNPILGAPIRLPMTWDPMKQELSLKGLSEFPFLTSTNASMSDSPTAISTSNSNTKQMDCILYNIPKPTESMLDLWANKSKKVAKALQEIIPYNFRKLKSSVDNLIHEYDNQIQIDELQ
ncbi:Uncharacterized protein Fot_17385 [Forsythia ovata]|uniref:Uncharacterized protein n=1 Tax=Forsythia ovata TaxID=205694 RepID=A0ABD1VF68_9LAMI